MSDKKLLPPLNSNPPSLSSMVKSDIPKTLPPPKEPYYENEASVVRSKAFYYDRQVDKVLTHITLHANKYLDNNGEWQMMTSAGYMLDEDGYNTTALYKGVLDEDFIVQAGNSWTDFGDDMIGSLWNSLKPYAPYAEKLSEVAGTMLGDTIGNTTVEKLAKKALSTISSVSGTASKLLNRSLVTQGTRFSYYSGTSTSFGNLAMKFTVLPEYVGDGVFYTVQEQLKELYPYIMGQYTKGIVDGGGNIQGTTINTGVSGENGEMLNTFFSWQMPPGGYEPDLINIDNTKVPGTLKLKFGAFYALPALVCTNAQFGFSKQVVKYWDKSKKKNTLSPLYCDVVLNFQPSTKYSDISLKKFISGQSTKDFLIAAKNNMRAGLKSERDKIDNLMK